MSIIKFLAIVFAGAIIGSGFGLVFMLTRCLKKNKRMVANAVTFTLLIAATVTASVFVPALAAGVVVGFIVGLLACSCCAISGDEEEYCEKWRKEMERRNVEQCIN